ncbi:hypothetical protein AQUCO_06400031v1 [Aquilegia coerulea]|uniref:Uncharacterized protein n=1 Tax=Aquilegia coerulea TaxID=218851 RepID=A0A2G5CDR3_AQUCA|nr:hypothetical protein AQUCO_06400031v1 [Aquilegia coerulea]
MASSEPTEGTCSEQQRPTNVQKLKVTIELDGRATGDNAAKWDSRIGHYVRMIVPISFADFKLVKENYRNDVSNGLMVNFLMVKPWKNVLYARKVSIQSIGRHSFTMS